MRVKLTEEVLRARIIALLKIWPNGTTTGGAIQDYAIGGCQGRKQGPALLAAMLADGLIERCEFQETAYAAGGTYRRTFQGYRLARKEASCPTA